MAYGQPRIPIGKRREQVQLQQAVTADDGMGGTTITKWKTVGQPWANVQPFGLQDEGLSAGQLTAGHQYYVVIPYANGITPKHRLVVRGVSMEIHQVVDDEGLRRRLFLHVGEVQA